MHALIDVTCDHGPHKALCNHRLYYFKNEHQQTELRGTRAGENRYVIQILA